MDDKTETTGEEPAAEPRGTLRIHRTGWLKHGLGIGVAMTHGLTADQVDAVRKEMPPSEQSESPWNEQALSPDKREKHLRAAARKAGVRIEFVDGDATPGKTLRVDRDGWLKHGLSVGIAMLYGLSPENPEPPAGETPGDRKTQPWNDAELPPDEWEKRLLAAAQKAGMEVEFVNTGTAA